MFVLCLMEAFGKTKQLPTIPRPICCSCNTPFGATFLLQSKVWTYFTELAFAKYDTFNFKIRCLILPNFVSNCSYSRDKTHVFKNVIQLIFALYTFNEFANPWYIPHCFLSGLLSFLFVTCKVAKNRLNCTRLREICCRNDSVLWEFFYQTRVDSFFCIILFAVHICKSLAIILTKF